jgi:hypothetical protein
MGNEVRRPARRGACAQRVRAKRSLFLFKNRGTGCENTKRVAIVAQREHCLLHVFFLFYFPHPT